MGRPSSRCAALRPVKEYGYEQQGYGPCRSVPNHPRRQEPPVHRGPNSRSPCATGARSTSTASASRTSPRIRRSATLPPRRTALRCPARRESKEVLTAPTDTGSSGYTHKFFKAARLRERGRVAQRDAIAAWARISYGWMGRSPTTRPPSQHSASTPSSTASCRQRPRLAQARAGGGALSQPRPGQSADRPRQGGRAGQGRLHHHPEGDRRRHLRVAPRSVATNSALAYNSSARTWARRSTIRPWW